MDEKAKTEKERKPVLVFRDRMGGASAELKEHVKVFTRIRKDLTAALKKGPRTIPELARETGIEERTVVWQVMAMKRYGLVVEGRRRGDCYEYALKEGA